MREYEKSEEGLSEVYSKMRMTAEIYLDLGPEAYRNMIDPDLQLMEIPSDMLDNIGHGMRQILEGRGLKQDHPFTGLDIDGFYTLAEMLGLEPGEQSLIVCSATEFLDEMDMVDAMSGERIVLYNLVPSPAARRAAEAAGGRKIRTGPERPRLYKERQ